MYSHVHIWYSPPTKVLSSMIHKVLTYFQKRFRKPNFFLSKFLFLYFGKKGNAFTNHIRGRSGILTVGRKDAAISDITNSEKMGTHFI
jgi:hypothetical protein